MTPSHPFVHDVVIVGAGPVGLFLACELRLAGTSVLVLEQADDPFSPLKAIPFGMRGLTAPTLDALYRRDLLDDVRAAGNANAPAARASAHWMQQPRRPAGHFAGIPFFHEDVDPSRWPYHLPDNPAGVALASDMQSLETILAARAVALGAEIRRGTGVEGFEQSQDSVIVDAPGEAVHARWLVGCDGGRSVVRKAGGIDLVGTDPEFTGYSIEVELANPDLLEPGRTYTPTGMYTYAKPGTIAMVDFDGGACHRTQPTLEHVQAVLRRISGTSVTLTRLRFAATWTDRARQAAAYRTGRVLLAGDAAHIHSPLGGQGLNLGLGDAMNLGWKLAATVRGHAPPDLLDSYCAERHPEGARILNWSRAQVALMRPSPSTRALGAIVRDLIATGDGATYFAERIWGVSLRYDLGGGHPLIGRSVPDIELADGTRVGQLLRSGRGLLLDLASDAPLHLLAKRWEGRIDYVASDAKNRLGLSALLVRPDGIVAWTSEAPADAEDVVEAALRWFGSPHDDLAARGR